MPIDTNVTGNEVVPRVIVPLTSALSKAALFNVTKVLIENLRGVARLIKASKWKFTILNVITCGVPVAVAVAVGVGVADIDICRFENGKIVEHWGVPDRYHQLAQLGLLPGPQQQPA